MVDTMVWGAVALGLLTFVWWRLRGCQSNSVVVMVLGDFGRSPRMQYHTQSLASLPSNIDVNVIAYAGSRPLQAILDHPRINVFHIRPPPALPKGLPKIAFLLYAPVKVVVQAVQLLFLLLVWLQRPSHVLIQNPPTIPTFPIAWLVCRIRSAKFVIDWHNYGYTILGLNVGEDQWLCKIAKTIEQVFGTKSDLNMCVTKAMQQDLADNWGVQGATVLHDRPPPMFAPTSPQDRHALFTRLQEEAPEAFKAFGGTAVSGGDTLFTSCKGGGTMRPDRPALIVSSTSWTPDEDFQILLDALVGYEKAVEGGVSLPNVVCIITGKGPMRAYYEGKVAEAGLKHVRVATMWLKIEDYPLLLGSADLGISLHTSSSGLDLPMKVVDMFGCGLPVCAVDFKCLSELVLHEKNGLVFKTEADLTAHLVRLLADANTTRTELAKYQKHLESFRKNGWADNWNNKARPLFVE